MKFTSVIICFAFYAFFSSAALQAFNGICRLEKRRNDFRNEALSTRFLAESFRKTCEGGAFESLADWKEGCRALWKPDYIAFREEGELLCGVWIYASKRHEVYYRKRGADESRWN